MEAAWTTSLPCRPGFYRCHRRHHRRRRFHPCRSPPARSLAGWGSYPGKRECIGWVRSRAPHSARARGRAPGRRTRTRNAVLPDSILSFLMGRQETKHFFGGGGMGLFINALCFIHAGGTSPTLRYLGESRAFSRGKEPALEHTGQKGPPSSCLWLQGV